MSRKRHQKKEKLRLILDNKKPIFSGQKKWVKNKININFLSHLCGGKNKENKNLYKFSKPPREVVKINK